MAGRKRKPPRGIPLQQPVEYLLSDSDSDPDIPSGINKCVEYPFNPCHQVSAAYKLPPTNETDPATSTTAKVPRLYNVQDTKQDDAEASNSDNSTSEQGDTVMPDARDDSDASQDQGE